MSSIDKTKWLRGEWNDEPDEISWQDEKTGLSCLILRTECTGALCGYVGVSSDHSHYKKSYNELEKRDDYPDVHGGLTYAGERSEEGLWWFGFDCAHCGDFSPAITSISGREQLPSETYKNVAYVKTECAQLARQLRNMVE